MALRKFFWFADSVYKAIILGAKLWKMWTFHKQYIFREKKSIKFRIEKKKRYRSAKTHTFLLRRSPPRCRIYDRVVIRNSSEPDDGAKAQSRTYIYIYTHFPRSFILLSLIVAPEGIIIARNTVREGKHLDVNFIIWSICRVSAIWGWIIKKRTRLVKRTCCLECVSQQVLLIFVNCWKKKIAAITKFNYTSSSLYTSIS